MEHVKEAGNRVSSGSYIDKPYANHERTTVRDSKQASHRFDEDIIETRHIMRSVRDLDRLKKEKILPEATKTGNREPPAQSRNERILWVELTAYDTSEY